MVVAVCEDSPDDLRQLKTAIEAADEDLKLHIELNTYTSGEALIDAVESGAQYPLIFLDIYMQKLDGVKTARLLKTLLPEAQLVFLTTSQEFMLDAFDLNALHYVLKPIDKKGACECLEWFCARSNIPARQLVLKAANKEYAFPLSQVQKIVSSRKGIDVCMQNMEPVHIAMSFASVEEQLDSQLFLKISRGFIVQMSFIRYIDRTTCYLKDDSEVLISRNEKEEIRRRYNDYLFRK